MSWFKTVFFLLLFTSRFEVLAQEVNKAAAIGDQVKGEEVLTKISGTVSNPIDQAVGLRFFTDNISFDEELFKVPIGSDHIFSIRFLLSEPTVAIFSYYGLEFELYIEPGDELSIDFDALNMWESIDFKGKGSTHNTFLFDLERTFRQWNSRSIVFEIVQRQAMDFRRLLDRLHTQKLSYFKDYTLRDAFSSAFLQYIQTEIDYWWAYQLLRYRVEHAVANGLEAPMNLPDDYYLFLNKVLISNDAALNNRNYLFFLDQYLSFCNENHPILRQGKLKLHSVLITAPSLLLLSGPDQPPVLGELTKGTRVKYLEEKTDFQSQILIGEVLQEGHWYKVRTAAGVEGWLIGVGIKMEKNDAKGLDDSPLYRQARRFLKGHALDYTVANDIYWRLHLENPENIKEEVQDFLLHNEVPSYRKIIENAYQEALDRVALKGNSKVYQSLANNLVIKNPELLSQKGAPLKIETTTPVEEAATEAAPVNLPAEDSVIIAAVSPKIKEKKRKRKRIKTDQEEKSIVQVPQVPEKKIRAAPISTTKDTIKIAAPEKVVSIVKAPPMPYTPSAFPVTTYAVIDPKAVTEKLNLLQVKVKTTQGLDKPLKLVVYEDPILFTEKEIALTPLGSNQLQGQMGLAGIKTGYLKYGEKKIDLYLDGKNDLIISFDPPDFEESLRFSGPQGANNNLLQELSRFHEKNRSTLQQQIKEATPNGFKGYLQSQKFQLLKLLDRQNKLHSMDRRFLEFAKADIDYWYAYNLLNFPTEHPLSNGLDAPMAVPDDYYSFFEEVLISNELALPNAYYTYFLGLFFDYQAELKVNERMSEMDLAKKYLSGDAFQYYTARLLSMGCKRGKALELGPIIQSFIAGCNNESYNNVLRQVYNEAKGLSTGDMAPDFSLQDINGNTVNLSDFSGKVVYVDFWASWCSPCILQMRNSKQWKAEFAGKDVVFVYISLDKDLLAWKQFVRSNGLSGIHLKSDGADVYQSKIARLYKVERLPASFVVDGEGRVAYISSKDAKSGTVVDYLRELVR